MDQITPFNRQGKNTTRSTKSRARGRAGTTGKRNKLRAQDPQGRLIILIPQVYSNIVQRRFLNTLNLTSDASGNVLLVARGAADAIASLAAEWTNFAQEFLEFRVVSLGYWFTPATTNATSSTGPYQGCILAAPWAQLKISAATTIYQSNSLVKFSTLEEKEIIVKKPSTINSSSFNPYGTALPIDRDFGIAYFSPTTSTLATSSRIMVLMEEMWVEFRTPQ